jgi:eukaryotic translation initiation factor 2C
VSAIKAACTQIRDGYNPPLTFVVVQKRHNTRFFVTDPNMADKSGNPPAGLVVDTGVCHPT